MEALDYFETQVASNMEILRRAYDDLHERAYKLAALLVGGGGAAVAYALAEFSKAPISVLNWAPIAGLSLTWFVVAGRLVWCSVTAREVSAGPKIDNLRKRYEYELVSANGDKEAAVTALRLAALDKAPVRVKRYIDACAARADAIDLAYRFTACSPFVAVLIALACLLFRR